MGVGVVLLDQDSSVGSGGVFRSCSSLPFSEPHIPV